MSSKPSVIVFGGLNTAARALGTFLIPDEGEPLVSHVRFVDRYSVKPPTTYLGPRFPRLLGNPIVEYRQVNVTMESAVSKAFDPPEGVAPYSYVIDMTGQTHVSRPPEMHIDQTAVPAFLLGREATKRKVKAYVRITQPFYQTSLEKVVHDEADVIKPMETVGTWYHEALRILANFKDLNLIILRPALMYGPWLTAGFIAPLLCLGVVYQELKQEFKALWSPGIRQNTIHVEDVAGGAWAAAEWIAKVGRAEANMLAGEDIYFANDKLKVQNVRGAADPDVKLTAPLFNLVDETDTTLGIISMEMATTFGIQTGFHGLLHNTWAQMKLEEVLEEINEEHIETWSKIIMTSDPPIPNTPLTPYIEPYMLEKRSFAYKGEKIQRVIGYRLRHPRFDSDGLVSIINGFKEDGIWPNIPGRP